MKSANQHVFSSLPSVDIARSAFKRPMTYKTTMDAGKIYPVYYEDVLPGDTVNFHGLSVFCRMMTLITPVLDNIYLDLHAWFVPNRLVWDNWKAFCGERTSPVADYSQDTVYTVPQLKLASGESFAVGSLADYFGLPTGVQNLSVDAMPFRAYNLIWNEFYRDENLQQPVFATRSDNDDALSNYDLLPRGKRKDAFTSALPWPQKGPGVELPLGQSAPVVGNGHALGLIAGSGSPMTLSEVALAGRQVLESANTSRMALAFSGSNSSSPTVGTTVTLVNNQLGNGTAMGVSKDAAKSGLLADLSAATAATINSIREAFQVQKLYERDARGGTRYQEIIVSHFGVDAPDARLQRPEFLGGTTIPINIHTVPQTSATDYTTTYSDTPQANLAAYGTAAGNLSFEKSFVEHGMLFVFASIRADLTYQQGIDRKWSRLTRFDYYWPALAHLGEDAVLNKEIFAQGTASVDAQGNVIDNQAFGYQERWYEYRYSNSKVTGLLRSQSSSNLDIWHLAQSFANLPTLNSTFIEENPPIARVIAVPSEPAFIYDSYIDATWVRPMPLYSVPGLVDHF